VGLAKRHPVPRLCTEEFDVNQIKPAKLWAYPKNFGDLERFNWAISF